jgi:hypothetical protein
VVVWIAGIYYLFNRHKFIPKKEEKPIPAFNIIAASEEPKIRLVFDENNSTNLDMKSLADLTVKYTDLISGNYALPEKEENKNWLFAEEIEPEKAEKKDLSDYINIFTIKNLKCYES